MYIQTALFGKFASFKDPSASAVTRAEASVVFPSISAASQKTRKTTAKMGGLCEERPGKGRGGRKVERKGQQQGPMETNYKAVHRSDE